MKQIGTNSLCSELISQYLPHFFVFFLTKHVFFFFTMQTFTLSLWFILSYCFHPSQLPFGLVVAHFILILIHPLSHTNRLV